MALAEVAREYWAHYERVFAGVRAARRSQADDDVVSDAVSRAISRGGREAVELIAELAATAPDDAALAYLGAGPMEELLDTHGSSVVDAIDERARTDARFRYALRCAWFESSLANEIVPRLRRYGSPP